MIRVSTRWNFRLWWSKEPILIRNEQFLWTLAVVLLATLTAAKDARPNVVAEVPTLDVGPVVVVTVIKGSAARLPCRHPHHPEDTLNLVLWYLDHSTRPFLSHDARSLAKEKYYRNTNKLTDGRKISNVQNKTRKASRRKKNAEDFSDRRSIRSSDANLKTGSSRRSLSSGGTTLIIQNVKAADEAEYRCRVHFRQSPTWTQRLKLVVADDVDTVVLEDSTGLSVNTRVGPLQEGSNLSLTCQASHGTSDVESLWWFLEGKPLDTSWASAGEDVVVNRLVVTVVQENFGNACVTCRLVTTNEGDPHVVANITERSITIAMFYVPVAVLKSDGGERYLGGVELTEGQTLSLLCSVRADPPVYNLIWLHNGQKQDIGGRFLARDNSSLVISPVTRRDSGIYACLASNSEGDGHSNAIPVVVKHLPYCAGPPQQELVVTANTSVTLTCQVDAQPKDVSFTWKIGVQSPTHRHSQSARSRPANYLHSSSSGEPPKDTKEDNPDILSRRFAEFPFLSKDFQTHLGVSNSIGLPSYSETRDGTKWTKSIGDRYGRGEWKTLNHQIDPRNPGRSTVTITPSKSTVVGCYARNSVGHAKVPCTYTLTVVEPPKPLQDCNVTVIGITRMEVRCDDRTYGQDPVGDASPLMGEGQHSPSMSFVRSPRSSTKANLEVWSGDTLVANVSEGRPIFNVRGLPPDAHLRLVLYTVSPHSHSTPLYMVAKTQPQRHVHLSVAHPAPQSPMQHPMIKPSMEKGTNLFDGFNWRLGGIMGGVAVMAVALVVGIVMWVWEKFAPWHFDHAQGPPHQLQHFPGITLDTLASEDSLNEGTSVVQGGVPPV